MKNHPKIQTLKMLAFQKWKGMGNRIEDHPKLINFKMIIKSSVNVFKSLNKNMDKNKI